MNATIVNTENCHVHHSQTPNILACKCHDHIKAILVCTCTSQVHICAAIVSDCMHVENTANVINADNTHFT